MLRRADVKAHDVVHFGHEVWIVESLKASVRCGWSPKTRQIRCTVDTDRPLAFAMPRELRWMAFSGQLSKSPRSRLRCGHPQRYAVPGARLVVQPSTRRSTKRRRLPSARQGPAWPPLPCSDRLPRTSARSALAAPAPAPAASSAASSATSVRHALHRSMSGRQVAGPPSHSPSLLHPPSWHSDANLMQIYDCGLVARDADRGAFLNQR